jgi:DNA-binding transcriptional regulator YiaG
MNNNPTTHDDKPYPRRCSHCGEVAVQLALIPYDAKIKHDGRLYEFSVAELPVDRCESCSDVTFTKKTADAKSHALRSHLGLLQPEEIRELLSRYGLTQRKFAEHLRVAEESVSRWLNGLSIQSRPLDTFMRLYFAKPDIREALAQEGECSILTSL